MERISELEREVREESTHLDSQSEYSAWEERCNECIALLEEHSRCKFLKLTIGAQSSIVSRIAQLESLKESVRRRFVHEGAGHSSSNSTLFWREIDTAFNNRVSTGCIVNTNYIEPLTFLEDAKSTVLEHVENALREHNSVKVNTIFNGEFVAGDKHADKSVSTRNCELYQTSDLVQWYQQRVIETTITSLEEFQERDSGWALLRIQNLLVNINKHNPMHAGCCFKIPQKIAMKKAIISIASMDNACFAWAVVAALYPAEEHPGRSSSYEPYTSVLNLEGIEFPMSLNQIPKFETLNDVSINVYNFEKSTGYAPLYLSKRTKNRHINLFYMEDPQNSTVGHFALIKNLSRLVSTQLSKNNRKKHICDRCLHYFGSIEKLNAHVMDCGRMNNCAIVLPDEENKWLSFQNHNRKERVPFVVYADLECILEKTGEAELGIRHHHKAFSIGYYIKCAYDQSLSSYASYRGMDCISWFANNLKDFSCRVKSILSRNVPMVNLSKAQWEAFRNATHCHICDQIFEKDDTRVRDHCHLTGEFRGAAHSNCNLNYKQTYYIPVVFHNLSGYDAHFIIKDIATTFDGDIELLPINKEKYISFTKHVKETARSDDVRNCIKLRFIDSYKFLNTSLNKLASYLDINELQILKSQFQQLSNDDFQLLTRKGIFPYEYLDCEEKLQDTCLPRREAFYSSLTDETVSEADYEHASNVWQRFGLQTLGEYSDLYLKTDVLLLAEVFENFRRVCIESYGLDPAHYYTLPGFTWDAMLKHTKVTFELLTDVDMVLFIERGIRGGLSQCSNRYAKANNKYMESYDASEASSYLMYFDVNNLYGWAMCEPLPYDNFQWVDDIENFDLASITADSPIGYILEVDLEYPQEVHDDHADLPFCPTRDKAPGKKEYRLLATLYDKQRYVIHYRNLQQCERHGIRIAKIHRILQFSQSAWLKGYIQLNTQFRTRATNDFDKNLYKLMNNAVFGKTMENMRNHVDVKLLTTWEGRYGAEAMIAKPNFHSRSIFSENLIAVELRKLSVKFNKPIYVGMCILDISKICLYEFHHDYMIPMYRKNCKLMYTDTDSLIYHIQCDDFYKSIKENNHRFDTSDYPVDNVYDIPLCNKKVPGLMKDENNGAIMSEFVGLRAKMYALRVAGKNETKKAKGISGNVVAKSISFTDYTDCLEREIEMSRTQSRISSKLHKVYTVKEKKIALSPHDEKRYIIPNSTDTLPWGHYNIPL